MKLDSQCKEEIQKINLINKIIINNICNNIKIKNKEIDQIRYKKTILDKTHQKINKNPQILSNNKKLNCLLLINKTIIFSNNKIIKISNNLEPLPQEQIPKENSGNDFI